jgi:methyl-accepting chemotaxis protein
MHVETSFWKRVGNMFRSSDDSEPRNGNGNGHGNANPARAEQGAKQSTPSEGNWSVARREPSSRELKDGYRKVGELMTALQHHFARQDERSEHLTRSVQQVAESLHQLSATQKNQGEYIRAIAERVEGVDEHAARLNDTISKLPSAMDAQAGAVQALSRQVELFQQADQRVAESLTGLSHAVESLGTSAAAQVDTLKLLSTQESEKREALTTLVKDQSRRFLIVLVITAILGIGALSGMGVTLAMILNRGG